MKNFGITACLLLCIPGAAPALESSTAPNDRASNAAMVRFLATQRADQLAVLAPIEQKVKSIAACSGRGRFYNPADADADAQGCTEIEVTVH